MGRSIEDALNDRLVTVVQRNDDYGDYLIRIGSLNTIVRINLRKTRGRPGQTAYTQTHAIKTPDQAGPYWTSRPEAETPGDALHKAIEGLTSYYRSAIANGHTPSEDWLVPGEF